MDRISFGAIVLSLFSYALACLYGAYRNGSYAYHDLGLINDFLSSTAHGRLFYATELGIDHLAWHFTPTLALISPLYLLFDSQFLLLALGCVSVFTAFLILAWIFRLLAERSPYSSDGLKRYGPSIFFIFMALNPFTVSILVSAHFEPLFMTLASAVLALLIAEKSLAWILPFLLLTLGVREDAGFFLSFHLLGLLLFPAWAIPNRRALRRRVIPLALFSFAYTVFVSKFVFHWFGTPEQFHVGLHWANFGHSWGEIAKNVILSPRKVLIEISKSGFLTFNASFLFLPLFQPIYFVLNTIPATLFYIGTAYDKKHLWYYSSSFLLPEMFLASTLGIHWILGKLRGLNEKRPTRYLRPAGMTLFIVLLVLRLPSLHFNYGGVDFRLYPTENTSAERFLSELDPVLKAHPEVRSIAADWKNVVFVPNRYPKYLLDNFEKADLAVFVDGAPEILKFAQQTAWARTKIARSTHFQLIDSRNGLTIYLKKTPSQIDSLGPSRP